jgi:hypothetical protein
VLAELAERDAAGAIAAIYAEIRRLWATPYVSSLQRHLATRPGFLEWAWAALSPAFTSGVAQTAAWRAVDRLTLPALPAISRHALRVWGVDDEAEAVIRTACASFARVSPINLAFSGLLRRRLAGDRPGATTTLGASWVPPSSLGPLPPMVGLTGRPPAEVAVLASLATTVAGRPFVPGLYRMLAAWPAFLAHVATVLRSTLDGESARAAARQVLDAIDAAVPVVFAQLPPMPATPPRPSSLESAAVLAALDTYRLTSPEMIIVGRALADALPV